MYFLFTEGKHLPEAMAIKFFSLTNPLITTENISIANIKLHFLTIVHAKILGMIKIETRKTRDRSSDPIDIRQILDKHRKSAESDRLSVGLVRGALDSAVNRENL